MSDSFLNSAGLAYFWAKIKTWVTSLTATDDTAGLIKLDTASGITLDADGKLTVNGRLGQFPDGGLYYSPDRQPLAVGAFSLLVADALGMSMTANRSLGIVSGVGLAVKGTQAAGTTTYQISNTYQNRIEALAAQYVSLDEATSKVVPVVPVVSCTIDGQPFTPDSAPNDTTKNIVLELAETINPDTDIASGKNIRIFGELNGYASAYIGSGVSSGTGGANFLLGQGVRSLKGNMNVILGQYQYNEGNGNALFGRWHVSKKNRWLLAGTGHDNTDGITEAGAAVGAYSRIDANTLFAVGNGASHVARRNAFEVTAQGEVVLVSPDGTRWALSIGNDGTISTTAL